MINQTWLPSQCGAIVLIAARRSLSVLPTKGMIAMEPMSKPSVKAKPINKTPTRTHQMILSNSYSIMIEPPQQQIGDVCLIFQNDICQYAMSLGQGEQI